MMITKVFNKVIIALTCAFGLVGVRDSGVPVSTSPCEYTFTFIPASSRTAVSAVVNGMYVEPVFALEGSFPAGTALATNDTSSSLLLLAPRPLPLPAAAAAAAPLGRFHVTVVCRPLTTTTTTTTAAAAAAAGMFSWNNNNNNNTTSSAHHMFWENANNIMKEVLCLLCLLFLLLAVVVIWLFVIFKLLRYLLWSWLLSLLFVQLLWLYRRSCLNLADLERHAILEKGGFGQVFLVSEKKLLCDGTHHCAYALKKQLLKRNNIDRAAAIHHEMNVMQTLCHPFLVHLVKAFQDENAAYFLMPFLQGGMLMSRLGHPSGARLGLPEAHAKFYAFCIADALSYMHSRNCAHNDLKSINVLIDSQGYPVIVDFGCSKFLKEGEKDYVPCGTPAFAAPEMYAFSKDGHDCRADLYSFGALVYELLTGWALYECEPSHLQYVSHSAVDLLKKLLEVDPSKRPSAQEVLAHPWFDGLDVASLRQRKFANVPWVPKVNGPLDTSYFPRSSRDL